MAYCAKVPKSLIWSLSYCRHSLRGCSNCWGRCSRSRNSLGCGSSHRGRWRWRRWGLHRLCCLHWSYYRLHLTSWNYLRILLRIRGISCRIRRTGGIRSPGAMIRACHFRMLFFTSQAHTQYEPTILSKQISKEKLVTKAQKVPLGVPICLHWFLINNRWFKINY